MSREPVVGGDVGNWGNVLNDFLSVSHNSDGTLNPDGVGNPFPGRLGGTTSTAKRTPYYNVMDFGAVGNGVADDTAAINACFAAAVASPGWVVFPKGTFLVSNTIGPVSTVNGLKIIGSGIGSTTILSNQAGGGVARKILGNAGNDTGWVVEGLTFQGAGGSLTQAVTLGAGGVFAYGNTVTGFFAVFLNDSQIRQCEFKNCNTGAIDYNGNFNTWDVHCFSNRNVGLALLESSGTVVNGLCQVQNMGNSANGELIANIFLGNITNGHGGPAAAKIQSPIVDELGLNNVAGGASIHAAAATDSVIDTQQLYASGKKQGANAAYYGIRIGPLCTRMEIRGTRVQPYVVDATRVPDHTIWIEAGATGTMLADVATNPNLANGGGDILDQGTNTLYRNCSFNGGPYINSMPIKAGVPADGDYIVAPPIGATVLDTTDGKIYYRTAAATWKAATLT